MKSYLKSTSLYVVGTLCTLALVAVAGSLTPSVSPATTMLTLEDLYQKTQDFTYATSSHSLSTSSSPLASMHTLEEIWNSLIANPITSDIIISGNTIMGITGTAITGETPLQWETDPSVDDLTWTNAWNYCSNMPDGNTWDWRLPEIWELLKAIDDGESGFTIDIPYWTNTSYAEGDHWLVLALDNSISHTTDDFLYNVRCVR